MKLPSPVSITFDRNGIEAASMVRELQGHGYIAYFAGGCVRDLLLGRIPHDYDIATNASPDQILTVFPDAKAVGRSFPVVRLTRRGRVVDIASFRQEGAYLDGRHPTTTSPGTHEQDAQRRDFTINALYLDPSTFMIVDEVNGLSDLRLRILQFVGDPNLRLEEDHLRLMRAVRFATTLDFTLDPATFAALKRHAPRLSRISPDRIRDELTRCLTEAVRPEEALLLLVRSEILPVILPTHTFPDDQLAHIQAMYEQVETKIPVLMLAILLHVHRNAPNPSTATPASIRHTLEQLRFSNDFTNATLQIISLQDEIKGTDISNVVRVHHLVADPHFPLALEMLRLECLATGTELSSLQSLTTFRNSMPQTEWLPNPWVTGDDLIALGVPPGPAIAHWKRIAHEQQILRNFPDRSPLLDWLKTAISHPM